MMIYTKEEKERIQKKIDKAITKSFYIGIYFSAQKGRNIYNYYRNIQAYWNREEIKEVFYFGI